MSFPRYPKYKASGVEWLGEVPEHWGVTQLKRVVDPERQITYGIVQAGPHIPDGVPYIRPADMADEKGVLAPDEILRTSPDIANAYSRSAIRPGDLVCSIGPSFGKVMVTPQWLDGANLTQGTARIAVQQPHNTQYLFWTLRSRISVAQWESSVGGATFRALNLGPLAETTILVPYAVEQTQIAVFLDRETAKIDELVAEQRRLIELLKEKRTAVISHAVIKGLNPDAPMKPSGIEWLDRIPSHWRVSAIKHLAEAGGKTFTDGDWIESPFITTEGIRLIQTGNVGIGYYKEQGFRYISAETFEQLGCTEVKPRDVIICRLDGPVGRACLAPDLGVRMITSVDNAILKCAKDVSQEFVVALLSSVPWISWIDAICRVGGGFRLRVSRNQLGEIRVPLPPFEEQHAIARYLASETTKWDDLAAEAQHAIDLLQERRTALISAATTGQIDVRPLNRR
jgi:type I restriction enzyme, S subunit